MELDETDRRIVDALADGVGARDGAIGRDDALAGEVASATGIAPPVVRDRLDALAERGIVDGFEPRLDYSALGYDVTAILRVSFDADGPHGPIDRLRADEQLLSVYEVTGADDVVAVGKFESVAELRSRVGELLASREIEAVKSTIALDVVKEDAPLAVGAGSDGADRPTG